MDAPTLARIAKKLESTNIRFTRLDKDPNYIGHRTISIDVDWLIVIGKVLHANPGWSVREVVEESKVERTLTLHIDREG